jgi:hypothetical protein
MPADYRPDEEDAKKIKHVYDRLDALLEDVMERTYPEMNDRNVKQFIDDSQKRLNAYVRTKAEQGKEEWQANLFTGSTRNKLRSYVGSVSQDVPSISITSRNPEVRGSKERADWLNEAVRCSFTAGDNPEMDIFMDGWDCSGNGTVIRHEYWLKEAGKVETVTSFDSVTGKVTFVDEEYDGGLGRPDEICVPVEKLIPGDAYISDIQEQPELIWVDYYDRAKLTAEFGKYSDFDKIQASGAHTNGELDAFFGTKWNERAKKDEYEVVRYYSKRMLEGEEGKEKLRSCYRIVVNGVMLLDSPLLWGGKKKKYPFAKTVFEPFAKPMFWGNSLPNIVMALQDEENALENSMLDKVHRSLVTPMLVGNVNKDDMELEDRMITGSDRVYVEDVDAIKPMPVNSPTQGEFSMLDRVGKMLSDATTDALQGGSAGSGSTAREVLLADNRATQMKGIFYLMLKDLWLQKSRLRADAIISHHAKADGKGRGMTYNSRNAQISGGRTGTMRLMVRKPEEISEMNRTVGYDENREPFNAVDVMEQEAKLTEGTDVEIMAIPFGYLDGYEYELTIQTDSMRQKGKGIDMALNSEMTTTSAKLFPEEFMANRRLFFDEMIKQYGQDPARYKEASSAVAPDVGAGYTPTTDNIGIGAQPLEGMGKLK